MTKTVTGTCRCHGVEVSGVLARSRPEQPYLENDITTGQKYKAWFITSPRGAHTIAVADAVVKENDMSKATKTCSWITGPGTYCGDPVKYKMVEDGGEPGAPKVRSYNAFCEKHGARAAEVEVELEDSEDELTELQALVENDPTNFKAIAAAMQAEIAEHGLTVIGEDGEDLSIPPAVVEQPDKAVPETRYLEVTLTDGETEGTLIGPADKIMQIVRPEAVVEPAEREDDVVVASAIQASPLDADRVEQIRRVRVHADWAHKHEPTWERVFDMTDEELVPLFGRSRSGDTAIRKVEQHIGAKPIQRVRVSRDDAPAPEIELQRPACPVCHQEKSVMGGCQCDVDGGRGEAARKLSSKVSKAPVKKENS